MNIKKLKIARNLTLILSLSLGLSIIIVGFNKYLASKNYSINSNEYLKRETLRLDEIANQENDIILKEIDEKANIIIDEYNKLEDKESNYSKELYSRLEEYDKERFIIEKSKYLTTDFKVLPRYFISYYIFGILIIIIGIALSYSLNKMIKESRI